MGKELINVGRKRTWRNREWAKGSHGNKKGMVQFYLSIYLFIFALSQFTKPRHSYFFYKLMIAINLKKSFSSDLQCCLPFISLLNCVLVQRMLQYELQGLCTTVFIFLKKILILQSTGWLFTNICLKEVNSVTWQDTWSLESILNALIRKNCMDLKTLPLRDCLLYLSTLLLTLILRE